MVDSVLGMSVDETISYLARSAIPTLLVEGSGDRALLRRVEAELKSADVDILPVGGKGVLKGIFDRRDEIHRSDVVFLRDKDEWVVLGVPHGHEEIILTNGYSIENDILCRDVIDTLAVPNADVLHSSIDAVSVWFIHAVKAFSIGEDIGLSRDVSGILDGGIYSRQASEDIDRYTCDEEFLRLFNADKWIWLRGKTLLRVIHQQLSRSEPAYSKAQIIDLCIRLGPSLAFQDLLRRIKSKFPSNALI